MFPCRFPSFSLLSFACVFIAVVGRRFCFGVATPPLLESLRTVQTSEHEPYVGCLQQALGIGEKSVFFFGEHQRQRQDRSNHQANGLAEIIWEIIKADITYLTNALYMQDTYDINNDEQ